MSKNDNVVAMAKPAVTLSSLLQKLMRSRGWNQSELAEYLGTNRDNTSRWLRGKGTPTRSNLDRIARGLHMPVEELIEITGLQVNAEPERTLAPTWRGMIPLLLVALRDGTDAGRRAAEAELYRMADAADFNSEQNR